MKRKLVALLLALTMMLALVGPASAVGEEVSLTSQPVYVDGAPVETEAYNIDGSNYFKLRDVAMMLSGTPYGFAVGYDAETGTVEITTESAYTPVGGELEAGEDKSATCVEAAQTVTVDGKALDVTVYNIGGNVFFKLRDLGSAIGFEVVYDAESNSVEITTGADTEEYLFRVVDPTPQKAPIDVSPLAERVDDFAGKNIAVLANYNGALYDFPEGIVMELVELLPDSNIIYVSEMVVATGQSTYPRSLEGVDNMTFAEFMEDPNSFADAAILLHGF